MAIREKVSGIGANSERTDLNVSQQPMRYISGLPQGQGEATYNQQGGAPMYETPLPEVTRISAPTQRKNEPITAGIDTGAGPDSTIIKLPNARPTALSIIRQIAQNDPSGETDLVFQSMLEKGLS